MGWPFQWVLQGLVVLQAGYTLAQERVLLAVVVFGLGNDTWIQIYGDWVKGKPLVLFPYSLSSTSPCLLFLRSL